MYDGVLLHTLYEMNSYGSVQNQHLSSSSHNSTFEQKYYREFEIVLFGRPAGFSEVHICSLAKEVHDRPINVSEKGFENSIEDISRLFETLNMSSDEASCTGKGFCLLVRLFLLCLTVNTKLLGLRLYLPESSIKRLYKSWDISLK